MIRLTVSHSKSKNLICRSPCLFLKSAFKYLYGRAFLPAPFAYVSNRGDHSGSPVQVSASCSRILVSILTLFAFIDSVDAMSVLELSQQQGQQSAEEVTTLTQGQAIEHELGGGLRHSYQILLTEGQYASIVVEQRGMDLLVRVLGADGKAIADFDAELRNQGKEAVELIAETAGSYRLVVEAKGANSLTGNYQIHFVELRAATERDRSLQEARQLLAESANLLRTGKFKQALSSGERALEIRERLLGAEHPNVASTLNNLASIYRNQGEFDKALELQQRALSIVEKTMGTEHPNVASALNGLATIYSDKGNYDMAETLYRQSLDIFEKTLGAEHPNVASLLHNLAGIYLDRGDFEKAEPLYQRTLSIKEKTLGAEHPNIATSRYNLARVFLGKGDFDKAEQLNQQALRIFEKALGAEHPNVAAALETFASVYLKKGDLEKAEPLYQRALSIREKILGPEHPNIAHALHNLALLYRIRGEFDKAESLYKRALTIREKTLGTQHRLFAASLNNLASIYLDRGNLDQAEVLYQQALAIREKALGAEQPDVANTLHNLAILYRHRREYDKAEQLDQRALEIWTKTLGMQHPYVAALLDETAIRYAAKGSLAQAVAAQSRANAINEHHVVLNLASGSERQKLAYLASLSTAMDRTISLAIRSVNPDDSAARELAMTAILQHKGRVLDALADSLTTLRRRFSEADQQLLDQLNGTIARLARLVLNEPQRSTLAEHQKRIKALEEERENLESEISRHSAAFRVQTQTVMLASVQAAIPADAALIEFAVYRPFDPQIPSYGSPYREPRYIAYVLRQRGAAQWYDLGDTKTIDSAIEEWRKALRDPRRSDAQQLARVVDEKLMQPLRPLLGDAVHLLISPDGALNVIPFEALVDEQKRYLVERFACSYLTSGRDLLRLQAARESRSAPLIVADPLFGEPVIARNDKTGTTKVSQAALNRKRQSITTAENLSSVYFAPLNGTAQEAQSIKSLFSEANLITGQQATESALKQAVAPSILHIATHGFFLQGNLNPLPKTEAKADATRSIYASARIENPLLRSGLALAGANVNKAQNDDGILTALEATGLNLWGTKLVTLSACDTGLGEVKTGEGVYGLRRAFVLAGTETVVMSLWAISDYVTREFMTGYYKGLQQGLGRGAALRQVQLSMLKRKGREHPFYWASFIQAGEWANLNGKR